MNPAEMAANLKIDSPSAAIAAMGERLGPVDTESLDVDAPQGRVLAQSLVADRDSPACDVSAMDGFAVRLEDLSQPTLPVSGEVRPGHPPPAMPRGAVLRIFTGAPVPTDCRAVIPREHVQETPRAIVLSPDVKVVSYQHIRRQAENGRRGQMIVEPGSLITPAVAAALSAFGVSRPLVHRRVRLVAVVTGNEVHQSGQTVTPWQLRDSNGPGLASMFAGLPWVQWLGVRHAPDDADALRAVIAAALADGDALLISGGVSMGDYDFVPRVLVSLGCGVVFHKLPIRPGKPVLGAIGPRGQMVMGLPGNPLSALTTARRMAMPVLRRLAGCTQMEPFVPVVQVMGGDEKSLPLHWMRPVRLLPGAKAALTPSQGSGDIISLAGSDGFVECPPHHRGAGRLPFYGWRVEQ